MSRESELIDVEVQQKIAEELRAFIAQALNDYTRRTGLVISGLSVESIVKNLGRDHVGYIVSFKSVLPF